MKVLHTVNSVGPKSFGLSSICLGLAKAQISQGEDVYVWSSDTEADLNWAADLYDIDRERLLGFPSSIPLVNISFAEIKTAITSQRFDVVHQHSLWTSQSFVSSILRKRESKVCIAAHGTLSEFALQKSQFKKQIALAVHEKRNLAKSSVLYATSEYEIEDFRRLGLTNPIAYIENGIGSVFLSKKGDGKEFKVKYNIPQDKKVLLYLSRITPKKGLDMLFRAISSMHHKFSDWVVVIVGNDEFGFLNDLREMLKQLRLEHLVWFVEPQFGDAKYDAFDAANFFVLPSYSEGSPMVVVEALAYGLPVITTKASSWGDLDYYACGFWVEIEEYAMRDALLSMVNLTEIDLEIYSQNAKRLIQDKYTWEKISKKTNLLYNWLVNKGSKPDFIF